MKKKLFGGVEAILFKGKRLKYLAVDKIENLGSIISDAFGGGGNWLKSEAL
jgi:hypothetical protein